MAEELNTAKERELIYKLQFQRGLSPSYIFLTKFGFFFTIFVMFTYYTGDPSITTSLVYVVVYWIIYKSFFPEKYTEKERVWLIDRWRSFTTERLENPIHGDDIIDWGSVEKKVKPKREKESKVDIYTLEELNIKTV